LADSLDIYNKYATAFKNKSFKPVYYFWGDEKYLIYKLQDLLVREALEPQDHDFNLSVIYGAEADAKAVIAECASYPLMAQRRVVLIREFEKMAGNGSFLAYTKNPNPTSTVLISSSGSGSTNPYRAIAAAAESANFKHLSDRQVPGWITEEIKSRGYKPSNTAPQMLAQLVGRDLRTLSTEIEKLLCFVGDRTDISSDDVLEVAGHAREHNVFELQRQVEKGEFNESARIMERMLQVSSNARGMSLMTVSVLSSYFNKLSKLDGLKNKGIAPEQLAKATGVPGFALKGYQSALRRFSTDELEAATRALLAADLELKGGSERDDRLILALLLRRLTHRSQRNMAVAST
jgi:DNA polymerase-3 subunit delta